MTTTHRRVVAAVALLARGEASLAGATRDVEAGGGTALTVPADMADADAVAAAEGTAACSTISADASTATTRPRGSRSSNRRVTRPVPHPASSTVSSPQRQP